MAAEEILSRDYVISINTGTIAVPVWTVIGGLDDDGITYSPSNTTADARVAADGGWAKPAIIGRGAEYKLKGKRYEDPDDGTRDAGQSAVETYGRGMNASARAQFKLESPATTPETLTFMASVDCTPMGGGEFATWEATLMVYGEPTVS